MQAYQHAGMPQADQRLQGTSFWVPGSGGKDYMGAPFPSPVGTEVAPPLDRAGSALSDPAQAHGSATWASTLRESLFSAVGLASTTVAPVPTEHTSPIPPVTVQAPTVKGESDTEDPYTRPLAINHRRPVPPAALLPGNGTPHPHPPSPIPGLPGFTPQMRSAFFPSHGQVGSQGMALTRSQSSAGSLRSRASMSTFRSGGKLSGRRAGKGRNSLRSSRGKKGDAGTVAERYKRRAREGRRS